MTCSLRVPRKARINATRVVEYVPQYDEVLNPVPVSPRPLFGPTQVSGTPGPLSGAPLTEEEREELAEYSSSVGDAEEVPEEPPFRVEDAAGESASAPRAVEQPFRKEDAADESASAAAPKPKAPPHPDDNVLLVDLPEAAPLRQEALKEEAKSYEHQLTHFPKSPTVPSVVLPKTLR